jgi:hypothetical protein
MASMIAALVVLLAAIGAAVWLVADARRRRAPAPRVGGINLFCGLLTLGLMVLHLAAVVGRAISGKGFGGETYFAYDFRFYSLLLLGAVIIIPGLVFVMHARRLTDGDRTAWNRTLWACGALLLINVPLVPIQAFALDPALMATIILFFLWADRKQFGAAQAG